MTTGPRELGPSVPNPNTKYLFVCRFGPQIWVRNPRYFSRQIQRSGPWTKVQNCSAPSLFFFLRPISPSKVFDFITWGKNSNMEEFLATQHQGGGAMTRLEPQRPWKTKIKIFLQGKKAWCFPVTCRLSSVLQLLVCSALHKNLFPTKTKQKSCLWSVSIMQSLVFCLEYLLFCCAQRGRYCSWHAAINGTFKLPYEFALSTCFMANKKLCVMLAILNF